VAEAFLVYADDYGKERINSLNAKFNPICHLLALLGAHLILHVSRLRVNGGEKQYNVSGAEIGTRFACCRVVGGTVYETQNLSGGKRVGK
jgi:hypothetical protein